MLKLPKGKLTALDQFPRPFHLSVRRIAWKITDIEDWIQQKGKAER